MRKKRKEEVICRFLKTLGLVEVTSTIGDAEPPIGCFIREKVINYMCHLESAWDGKTSARIDFVIRFASHPSVLMFLEGDEDQHKNGHSKYNVNGYSCDRTRMNAVMAALVTGSDISATAPSSMEVSGGAGGAGGARGAAAPSAVDVSAASSLDATAASAASSSYTRQIVWIRYNPDSFRVDGLPTPKYTQTEKHALLLSTMESAALALTKSESTYSIVYINYDLVTGDNAILTPAIFHDPEYPADMRAVASSASLYTNV